jgi:alcohol dehydrogenase class IV
MKMNLQVVGHASRTRERVSFSSIEEHKLSEYREACPTISRLEEFARMTGGTTAEEGIEWLENLCRDLQVPPLSSMGISDADFPEIVEKSKSSSSMKGNPVELTDVELIQILRAAL